MPRSYGFWFAAAALSIVPALSGCGTLAPSLRNAGQEPSPQTAAIIRAQFGAPSTDDPVSQAVQTSSDPPAIRFTPPAPEGMDKARPINLPTALQLANARPLDIALASQRIQVAVAGLDRANDLWFST